MRKMIYMDYMATTPIDPQVMQAMLPCLEKEGVFGNSSSYTHHFGWEAEQKVRQAQEQVATLINADPREIIWTSGATESNNLAIKGAAYFYQRKGKHIITMSTEHKAVINTCRFLESEGFEVTYLDPLSDGTLDYEALRQKIRLDTLLVSVMHVNNETGVIQDIAKISDIAHEFGALFHSDAAQSAGKVQIDVRKMNIDLMSFSAHKIYGPKGIGGLFISRSPRVRLQAQIHGGAQQSGLRSGTLPTHQIVGMGAAFEIAAQRFAQDKRRLIELREYVWNKLFVFPRVTLNGHAKQRVSCCINFCFLDVDAKSLLLRLNHLAISSVSACNSVNPEPSHVLSAMGLSRKAANHSLRISLGRFTTDAEVDFAISHITEVMQQLSEKAFFTKTV